MTLEEAQVWLANQIPRLQIIAVTDKIWGIKWNDEQLVCAPTIQECVELIRRTKPFEKAFGDVMRNATIR